MRVTATRRRFGPAPAGSIGSLDRRARTSTLVLLLAALFVPLLAAGTGEPERTRGPEAFALVSPPAPPEAPAENDTASAPLGYVLPAGLPSGTLVVPEPTWTRLAAGDVERLSGLSHRSSLAPPPRRT